MNKTTLYDPESHEPPDDPLLLRVLHGEWGIHDAEAGAMTAAAFGARYRQIPRTWGRDRIITDAPLLNTVEETVDA